MLGFVIAPFAYALLFLETMRAYKYLDRFNIKNVLILKGIVAFVLLILPLSILIAFLLPLGKAKHAFYLLGNYYFGFALYFFLTLGVCDIFRFILKRTINGFDDIMARNICFFIVSIVTTVFFVYGVFNAHRLRLTSYEVNIDKKADVDQMKIALIADLHLGYDNGYEEIIDTVNKINSINPDIVLIAGDIFDNEYEAIYEPDKVIEAFNSIKSKHGVYAVFGNHDIEEKIFCGFTFSWLKKDKVVKADQDMLDFLKKANINILYDDYVEVDGVIIYGRPDYEKPNLGNDTRLSAQEIANKVDINKPVVIIDHEPHEQEELAKAGFDLDLCGHTHNGQVWPGTITINWFWDNAYGYKRYDNLHNIVTSGSGVFGPNIRTGCFGEVVEIVVSFNKD